MLPDKWQQPPGSVTLSRDEVHVWAISVREFASVAAILALPLSDQERARAERFHVAADRERFIVAHGVMRSLLGRYLNLEPAYVPVTWRSYGKPMLHRELVSYQLEFNISHSRDLILMAVACERAVGIDIEYRRVDLSWEAIAQSFFAPGEILALHMLPIDARMPAFFDVWTRKEAYCKAIGKGLSLPFEQFEVSVAAEQPAVVLHDLIDPGASDDWSLTTVDAGAEYSAALAVFTHGSLIQQHCWAAHIPDVCS